MIGTAALKPSEELTKPVPTLIMLVAYGISFLAMTMSFRTIPVGIDYAAIHGMRSESKERLAQVRPLTVGQASRVAGVTPADVSVLLVHLERRRRARAG